MRPSLTAIAGAVLSTGCCSLAGLLCGPDTSQWVPIAYDTPRAALDTFLEAVRRDNPRVICESLSEEFKKRQALPGCLEAAIAWQRLKERTPGLHLLGSAQVSAPEPVSDGLLRYTLSLSGRKLRVDVRRHAFVAIRYLVEGAPEQQSRYVTGLTRLVQMSMADGDHSVVLHSDGWVLPPDLTAADLTGVGAGVEWKVDDLAAVPGDGQAGVQDTRGDLPEGRP